MLEAKKVINELLVEVFHHILSIEGANLRERGVDITMNEVHVLEAIQKTDEPTMGNIAHRLRITLGTLTTSVNRLEKKGYCKRTRSDVDKRIVHVALTEKAHGVMKLHDDFHEDMISAVIKDLGLDEDDTLIKSLKNISVYFKEKY